MDKVKFILNKIWNKDVRNILMIIFLSFTTFLMLHDICDSSIIGSSSWNSYEVQAESWLNHRLDVDYMTHLELAEFEGKFYISFPPFPSVVMLPFVAIWGEGNFCSNLLMYVIAALTMILVYKILRKYDTSEMNSLLIAFSMVMGSSMMAMALNSGVWFVAQLFNMFLCVLAVKFLLEKKKARTYFCLALAVGCRPFSAVYLIAAFLYFLIKDRRRGFIGAVLHNILPLIPMIIVALVYMGYNYARFGNPLEFGHNYLPEFTEEYDGNYGQFSLNYLWPNLKELFGLRIRFDSQLKISFGMPFMIFIANPLFAVYLIDGFKKLIKNKRISIFRLLFFFAMIANIISICLHKTLGGWQFGSRYSCDLLAFVLLCMLLQSKPTYRSEGEAIKVISFDESISAASLDKFQIACILFGIMLNMLGSIEYWNNLL